ncbi:DUF397 domain-containing protein [Streptomonospora algeriensis]|uniref:DUF397 domain-containing protein n=1 Tax=Streptomonospora algeriensis TaxID=995084 RepID=A0ABW3BD01_9ACTN
MYSFPDSAPWRTSSYTQQQNCVEVADAPGATAVRDTKHREQGHLVFPSTEWAALVESVRSGEL